MSVKKCYRHDCNNPGLEKYAKENVVSSMLPVCPDHQHHPERKKFEQLTELECAQLTDEDITFYATDSELGEEIVREQVESCKAIVASGNPSLAPKEHARKDLFKKLYDAMISADTALTDEEVVTTAWKTVEHYRKQYGVQPLQKMGK